MGMGPCTRADLEICKGGDEDSCIAVRMFGHIYFKLLAFKENKNELS